MPHKLFDLKKVCPVFVKMCSVCMAKCMAGDPPGPSKHVLMLMDMAAQKECVDRPVFSALFGEEEASGPSAGKPVLSKEIQGKL